MLTYGEDVEIHALRKRGWSYEAIGRHSGRDWRTVKAYLEGNREPGVRRRAEPSALERFVPYLQARFADDPHVWASALYDEVVELGYGCSYPSFARQVRQAGLRPHCEACSGVTGRDTIEIAHPSGEDVQWDWFERRKSPWGGTAYVLLGTLPYSGRSRGVICPATDQAHLVEAMDGVLRRLGGTAGYWRVDRMASVVVPTTGDVQASFAPVAKHYGAAIAACSLCRPPLIPPPSRSRPPSTTGPAWRSGGTVIRSPPACTGPPWPPTTARGQTPWRFSGPVGCSWSATSPGRFGRASAHPRAQTGPGKSGPRPVQPEKAL